MQKQPPILSLTGRIKAQVLNAGIPVGEPIEARNLWLDQGLDNLASFFLCDLFRVCAKGTGITATTEDLTASANTYSISLSGTTLTRTAGSRDFTSADIGKLAHFTSVSEFYITAITDTTHAVVSPAAPVALTNQKMVLYSVGQTALSAEVDRTQTYSQSAGDNSTSDSTNTRTFQRSFIFDTEDTVTVFVSSGNTYTQSVTTVTRATGTRDFVSGDIGKTLTFLAANVSGVIQSVGSTSTVSLNTSNTVTTAGAIKLVQPSPSIETVTGTYSRSGTTVTRASGSRNFSSGDVGKVIHFITANTEAKITVFTDTTHVTVDVSGTISAQSIGIYGFTDYNEVGFSQTIEQGSNINIRIVLASALRAYVSTPLRVSDQVKITYSCQLQASPATTTTGTLSGTIIDSGNAMSSDKTGAYAIETFATSTVSTTGETNSNQADLEPSYSGNCALSTDSSALAPYTNKAIASGATVPLVPHSYSPGSFSRDFTATFELADGNGTNWRSLMVYDSGAGLSAWRFLFNRSQIKDGAHTLAATFTKSWGRSL